MTSAETQEESEKEKEPLSAINGPTVTSTSGADLIKEVLEKFGLANIEDIYRLAVRFYREKEGKAFHASYDDRLLLTAYTKQVKFGKYDAENPKDQVGYFDVVGNDRRNAWESLGDISREEAMARFVKRLHELCPRFAVQVAATKAELEAAEEAQRQELAQHAALNGAVLYSQMHTLAEDAQRKLIQDALNQQTYYQFQAYAQQQFPQSIEKQEQLIKQLQEQHYLQYMQQLYAQHGVVDGGAPGGPDQQQSPLVQQHKEVQFSHQQLQEQQIANLHSSTTPPGDRSQSESPVDKGLQPASMWTRKDIVEFKESIKKEGAEGVVKVGNGETVTVRVPTHPEGSCLFWEFATDNYDIGFGVFFEWNIAETNAVSVHISESSDEDDHEETEANRKPGDPELGGKAKDNKPPQDEVIPVYRRDCHEEVYAGSHVYPGQGIYLLKFDNSYSLWRSKTLYYRVYYSR